MVHHLWNEYPREGCGLFIHTNHTVFYPCRNVAEGEHEFLIDDRDWIKAQLSGIVTGVVHSHPTTWSLPSKFDEMQAKHFNLPYYILSLQDYGISVCKP